MVRGVRIVELARHDRCDGCNISFKDNSILPLVMVVEHQPSMRASDVPKGVTGAAFCSLHCTMVWLQRVQRECGEG
jgi:hypothetical protein